MLNIYLWLSLQSIPTGTHFDSGEEFPPTMGDLAFSKMVTKFVLKELKEVQSQIKICNPCLQYSDSQICDNDDYLRLILDMNCYEKNWRTWDLCSKKISYSKCNLKTLTLETNISRKKEFVTWFLILSIQWMVTSCVELLHFVPANATIPCEPLFKIYQISRLIWSKVTDFQKRISGGSKCIAKSFLRMVAPKVFPRTDSFKLAMQ